MSGLQCVLVGELCLLFFGSLHEGTGNRMSVMGVLTALNSCQSPSTTH